MYLRYIVILFMLCFFAACRPATDESEQVPEYVLTEPVFIKVLTDCYLGEGAAGVNVKNVTGDRYDSTYIFNPFVDNGITQQQFDTTIAFYSKHPKQLKKIYEKLLDNLSQLLALGYVGSGATVNKEDYKNQDMKFYYRMYKNDSIINSTKRFGYNLKFEIKY